MEKVSTFIRSKIEEISDAEVQIDTRLLGEGGVIDSMGMVLVCLELEDLALEMGFTFDWTSDSAMSRINSMFSDISALASEFLRQSLLPE